MNTAARNGLDSVSWKDLYQAAIVESDLSMLPKRISEAEAALVIRARELFYAPGNDGEEAERLDNAICILQALRSSLKRRPIVVQQIEVQQIEST